MQATPGLEVAIVGGGVCGLTCAIALARRGINAHVYEAAAKFGEIGAGIGLGQNAIRILLALGVFDDILDKAGESGQPFNRTFQFYSGMDGHLVYDYPPDSLGGNIGVARSAFLDALVYHILPEYAHFNKRCVSVTQPPASTPSTLRRPTIHFADGTSAEADVVLLADGIRGAGRDAVTGIDPRAHVAFSNTVCYRGLIAVEAAKANGVRLNMSSRPMCLMGMDKHLIVFPIKGGETLNVVAFAVDRTVGIGEANLPDGQPTVVPVTKEHLLREYEGWGPDVLGILKCIENPSKWHINVVYPPLETYVKGRVALLGDAAHGMEPHLGAGAGQGIEDAYLLAQLLTHPHTTFDSLEAVLEAYSNVRKPRNQQTWEGSVRVARIYEGYGEHGSSDEGRRRDLSGIWDPVWHRGKDDDLDAAVELLVRKEVFKIHSARC